MDSYRTCAGGLEPTDLSRAYFSDENINYLQKQLHDRVYERSCKQFDIGRQSDRELMIIMRSYYLTYARHVPGRQREEIHELNERVLEYAVPNVLGAVSDLKRSMTDLYGPGPDVFDRVGGQTREYKTLQPNPFY